MAAIVKFKRIGGNIFIFAIAEDDIEMCFSYFDCYFYFSFQFLKIYKHAKPLHPVLQNTQCQVHRLAWREGAPPSDSPFIYRSPLFLVLWTHCDHNTFVWGKLSHRGSRKSEHDGADGICSSTVRVPVISLETLYRNWNRGPRGRFGSSEEEVCSEFPH